MFNKNSVAVVADGYLSNQVASYIKPYKLIVAVDNGLEFCSKFHLDPSLIIGDFDTVPPKLLNKYHYVEQIRDLDCNTTDLEKALNYLQKQEPKKIVVFGALGKRIDHTLTNICLLSRFGRNISFETENEIVFCIDKKVSLNCAKGQTISLIPLNGEATGITTMGLQWELTNGTLSKNFIGISNVATIEKVEIECLKGDLLVCINRL